MNPIVEKIMQFGLDQNQAYIKSSGFLVNYVIGEIFMLLAQNLGSINYHAGNIFITFVK